MEKVFPILERAKFETYIILIFFRFSWTFFHAVFLGYSGKNVLGDNLTLR
jgi:hypothetical protein